jgi:cob(I)alamin adenosyltransferase
MITEESMNQLETFLQKLAHHLPLKSVVLTGPSRVSAKCDRG